MIRLIGSHVTLALVAAISFNADAWSQNADPAKMESALAKFKGGPRFEKDTPELARARAAFVTGNVLFAVVHEVGHAVISEMGLPVLGREEDAADTFSTLTSLKIHSKMSTNVLMELEQGWFLSDKRDQAQGIKLTYYDEHGMDKQRAYNIICIMVGSDPKAFKTMADSAKMPEDRQGTCQGDYSNASWSWDKALHPHRRNAGQQKTKVDFAYLDAGPEYPAYAEAFKEMRFLETISEHLEEDFVWRRPIKFEMMKCGEPSAHWDLATQKIIICYELAEDFAQLYDFALPTTAKAKPAKTKRKKTARR